MNNEQNKWVPIAETKQYPAENETVWLYNEKDKSVMLGCHVYLKNVGWLWAVSNGMIYAKKGKIVSDIEIDDNYEITHWCALPNLP